MLAACLQPPRLLRLERGHELGAREIRETAHHCGEDLRLGVPVRIMAAMAVVMGVVSIMVSSSLRLDELPDPLLDLAQRHARLAVDGERSGGIDDGEGSAPASSSHAET
jgi:hypothetical protein